jgi:DNA modification methylase
LNTDIKFRHPAIVHMTVDDLVPYQGNARTHSRRQIAQIAGSIELFGFINPVVIDGSNQIIAGHGRIAAAKKLGLTSVPTLRIEHLSDNELRAYVLADNRLAEKAGWDRELLAIELQHLTEIEFDTGIIGFETPEIDIILNEAKEARGEVESPDDRLPLAPAHGQAISRPGDLWQLGSHRLLCGNALEPTSYARLLEARKVEMVITDPPFNVRIEGNVGGLGRIRHPDFAMASGEMSGEQFTTFLSTAFSQMAAHSSDGALSFVFMDWRHLREILDAGQSSFSELKNLIVWNKDNAGMGSLYRSKHELIFVFKIGTGAHINNVELGRHGRNRSNVWDYPGISSMRRGRLEELAMHPTVKPVTMIAEAIKDASHPKGLVLDPFAGSGTILIAAEKTGRRAAAIELTPGYVDVAVRRWQQYTGKTAVLGDHPGQTFEEIEAERLFTANVTSGEAA